MEYQRQGEQDERYGGRGLRRAALDLAEDIDRGRERLERDISGDDDDRTKLTDRSPKAANARREGGRQNNWEVDGPKDADGIGAKEECRFFLRRINRAEQRLDSAHDEGEGHEEEREDDRQLRKDELNAERAKMIADKRALTVERGDHDARDERRDGEREIDERAK